MGPEILLSGTYEPIMYEATGSVLRLETAKKERGEKRKRGREIIQEKHREVESPEILTTQTLPLLISCCLCVGAWI